MYTVTNYKTKKALKEDFAAKGPGVIQCYQPGGIFPGTKDGTDSLEGPHYPEPHRWYCRVELKDYKIVRIIS